MLPADRIPLWSHWRRVRLLRRAQEGVVAYLAAVRYEAFPFRVVETDEARGLREELEPELPRIRAVVRALGGLAPERLVPGERPGDVTQVDLVRDLFDLQRHSIHPAEAPALLEAARRGYEERTVRAALRTLNPFYWLDMVLSAAEAMPFVPLRAVGVAPGRAMRSPTGRVVRWWVRLAVLLLAAVGLFHLLGVVDDLHRLSDGVLGRVPALDRLLGHP